MVEKGAFGAARAVSPRVKRMGINTTLEVYAGLETFARQYGWSLSKAGHLALVEGLKVLEESVTVPSGSSEEGRGRGRKDSEWA